MDQVMREMLEPRADATLEETAKKTSGTMIMKIRFRNRSPRGLMVAAVAGAISPTAPPAMIEVISVMASR
jgi:hypothetical protein